MMEAVANGSKDQTIDMKPFFAVYKCDKPFAGPSVHDLYAGESVVTSATPHSAQLASSPHSRRTVSTAQEYRAPSVDASSLPEVRRPATGSPQATAFKPYGINAQAALHQSSSMQSVNSGVTTNSDIGDGASTTSYSRMMPAPVRLRTAAGGGVPGSMSREGIRQMKLKNASKLTR